MANDLENALDLDICILQNRLTFDVLRSIQFLFPTLAICYVGNSRFQLDSDEIMMMT